MLCAFCLESEVIQTPGYLSSAALVPVGGAAHYEAVARRILAALRADSHPFVLVTGDPPANPQVLSKALGNVAGPGYAVTIIPCGPELRFENLERTVPRLATPKGASGAAPEPERSASASPLLVFDDCDRLSDRQIEEIYKSTLRRDQMQGTAVLLAPLDFLVRLERPALHFLKEHIAAQFRFQDVGDGEAIAFLHNQLLAQRDRRVEARGFRHGILIGLAAGGVSLAASIGVFILHSTADQVCEEPASTGRSSSVSEKVPMLRPDEEAAMSAAPAEASPNAATTSVIATAPPPLSAPPSPPTKVESPPPVALPSVADPQPGPRLSASDIAVLLLRGDAFLRARDITSARLYFERAAEAGDGQAALQLGASFDPVMLDRAGIRGVTGDPAQALSWYRRARELGMAEADQPIKSLETRPSGEADTLSR
jgi:hypothetical protein